MKFLIYIVLATIISFFVWNSLKRIFFNQFYNHFPHQKKTNEKENTQRKTKKENVKWDAETVEYEEVEE